MTRKVDSSGDVCFAGASYRAGNAYRRRQVQVAVVGDTVEISIGTQLVCTHRAHHDRTREHGARRPGRPRRPTTPHQRRLIRSRRDHRAPTGVGLKALRRLRGRAAREP